MSAGDGLRPLPSPVDDIEVEQGSTRVLKRMFGRAPKIRQGRYVIMERLGEGATGVVYRAYDPTLRRALALKVLPKSANAEAWVRREGQSLAQLSHPNVVQVFDVGFRDGRAYLAMEFVDGPTLAAWCQEKPHWRDVVWRFVAAGRGLHAAHARGIVHRDFKLANVMIGADSRTVVLDFGLAQLEAAGGGASVAGTPAYMAPEQHRGAPATPASDQFGFCVALFEALYDARPFLGATVPDVAAAKDQGEVSFPAVRRHLPAALRRAILRGLVARADGRWPDMASLVSELESIANARARGVRVAAVGLALATVAGIAFADEDCEAPSTLDAVWNPARAGELQGPSAAHLTAALDRYAATWRREWQANCEAAQAANTQAEAGFNARADCLADVASDLDLVLETVVRSEARGADIGPEALSWLRRPEDCEHLRASDAVAPSPTIAADAVQLRREIREAELMIVAGEHDAGTQRAVELEQRVATLGHGPIAARMELLQGRVALALGKWNEAREHTSNAFFLASSHNDRTAAFEAALVAAKTEQIGVRFDAGIQWTRHARALLDPQMTESASHGRVLSIATSLHFSAGHTERAFADGTQAVAILEHAVGPDHPLTLDAMLFLGATQIEREEYDEALAIIRSSIARIEQALGPEHKKLTAAYELLGIVFGKLGEFEASLVASERAIELARLQFEPGHSVFVAPTQNTGHAFLHLGRLEEAKARFERALSIGRKSYFHDHPVMGLASLNLARVLVLQGEPDAALLEAEQTCAVFEPLQDASAKAITAECRVVQAHALLAAGEAERAGQAAQKALGAATALNDGHLIGDAAFAQAKVLRDAGDHGAATAAAETALDHLGGPGSWALAEKVRRFLEDR